MPYVGASTKKGSSSSKEPPKPLWDTINLNISSNGAEAIADANTILWDTKWGDSMNQIENDSKPYGHDCGTVFGNATKSKDQAAVESLNTIKDKANSVQGKLKDVFLKNIFSYGPNGAYKERKRILDTIDLTTGQFMNIPNSRIFLTESEIKTKTKLENQWTLDITGKIDTEKIRGEKEKKRGQYLDKSQATIRQEFADKKVDLNKRINIIDGKITDAKSVKSNRNSKKDTLIGLKQKVDVQKSISSAASTSLASAAAVNTNQLAYLIDRTTKTKDIAVDGYEELYKAVILQNHLLEVAKSEIENNISTIQRESKYVSKKRTFIYDIYIKLYAVYYIFIIFFIGFLIFYKKLWSIYYKIAVIIVGIIYPLCILTVESWIYNCWLYVLSLLTGSVYVYRPL